jgi:pyruvate/2-oxoglutarate dehydrogenase complex dihydrolipoamide acyltransferase (E2) component
MSVRRPEPERRHTLLFLALARQQSPILLDADVDMAGVRAHRAASPADRRPSYAAYVVHDAARELARHPEANAAIHGRLAPRLARFGQVSAKVAFDKAIGDVRAVVSGLLPDADRATLQEIEQRIRYYKGADPQRAPELKGVRTLQRLPRPLAAAAFRLATARLGRRPELLGTFSVSSLGHRSVGGFYPLGGTAISLGMGRVREVPVVRDGGIVVGHVMRLSLVFDHRVLDGAMAADILHDIKARLEAWNGCDAATPSADHRVPAAAAAAATVSGVA